MNDAEKARTVATGECVNTICTELCTAYVPPLYYK